MSREPEKDVVRAKPEEAETNRSVSLNDDDDAADTGKNASAPNSPQPPPVIPRSHSPILLQSSRVDGGRSTPVARPNRYQYQPSVTESESSYLGADREGYLPLHHMQTYIAVNPFSPSIAQSLVNLTLNNTYANAVVDPALPNHPHLRPPTPTALPPSYHKVSPHLLPSSSSPPLSKYILAFLFDVIPRQIYLHLLLTLPSLYFSRVARVFEEAELSMPDIKKMAIVTANRNPNTNRWKDRSSMTGTGTGTGTASLIHGANWSFEPSIVSPQYAHLKSEWEHFIDSLMKEWKTLNIVSVLLLSAILTTLQIDGAYNDPISRNAALLALVCAIMSLLYGCLYILRFNTMRKAHKAAEWAQEAQKTRTSIFWNVWVLLAMPAVWLSWSIIFYLACILSFVWRAGTIPPPEIHPQHLLGPRIAITAVFALGVLYFVLIVITFRRYGAAMDRSWRKRVREWVGETATVIATTTTTTTMMPMPMHVQGVSSEDLAGRQRGSVVVSDTGRHPYRRSFTKSPPPPPLPPPLPRGGGGVGMPNVGMGAGTPRRRSVPKRVHFGPVKVMDLRFLAHNPYERPSVLSERNIRQEDWAQFIADASFAWDGQFPKPPKLLERGDNNDGNSSKTSRPMGRAPPQEVTARYIAWWNVQFFHSRGVQAVLCGEYYTDHPYSASHAIYLVDIWVANTPETAGVDEIDGEGQGESESEGERGGDGGEGGRERHHHHQQESIIPLDTSAAIAERFGGVPEGLVRIDVYNPMPLPMPMPDGGELDIATADRGGRKTTRMGKTMILPADSGDGGGGNGGGGGATRVHWDQDLFDLFSVEESADGEGEGRGRGGGGGDELDADVGVDGGSGEVEVKLWERANVGTSELGATAQRRMSV